MTDVEPNRRPSRTRNKTVGTKPSSVDAHPARERTRDLLAHRAHSETELRDKLARYYETSEVNDALAFAHAQNWMLAPIELAERVAQVLVDKKKGARFINDYLNKKGLPPITLDQEGELRRARDLVAQRFSPVDAKGRDRAARLLTSRGFNDDVIREVLHETFGTADDVTPE